MKVVILQSNYIPWKGYFDLINDADVFCFYDEVQYTKNDWRNRNRIYSKNGLQWLTIPIEKDAVKLKISEVNLPEGWQQKHLEALRITYNRAPYFYQIKELLEELYVEKKFNLLADFNQYSIKKIAAFIGIKTEFVNSADYELRGDRVFRLINLIKDLEATEYISGPSAKDYLEHSENIFKDHGINLIYKKYPQYNQYDQLKQPFEQYVSIIDLLANVPQEKVKQYIWDQ